MKHFNTFPTVTGETRKGAASELYGAKDYFQAEPKPQFTVSETNIWRVARGKHEIICKVHADNMDPDKALCK